MTPIKYVYIYICGCGNVRMNKYQMNRMSQKDKRKERKNICLLRIRVNHRYDENDIEIIVN